MLDYEELQNRLKKIAGQNPPKASWPAWKPGSCKHCKHPSSATEYRCNNCGEPDEDKKEFIERFFKTKVAMANENPAKQKTPGQKRAETFNACSCPLELCGCPNQTSNGEVCSDCERLLAQSPTPTPLKSRISQNPKH